MDSPTGPKGHPHEPDHRRGGGDVVQDLALSAAPVQHVGLARKQSPCRFGYGVYSSPPSIDAKDIQRSATPLLARDRHHETLPRGIYRHLVTKGT